MADVIHRTTLEFRPSVNTLEFPEPTWKHNPSMSAVASVPSRYWKAPADWNPVGAGPVEMTPGEKATVDANALTARRDAEVAPLDNVETLLRAFMLIVLDEFNLHSTRLNALLTAIDNNSSLANIKTAVLAIQDIPARTAQQLRDAMRGRLGT